METNVGNEKRELRIEYFRETGLNAMKSNFTYMNWLEERHIKQLALFSVVGQSEQLKCDCKCPVPYKDGNKILACRKCHNEI